MKLILGFIIVISFIVFLVRFYCSEKASKSAYKMLEASQTNESVDAFIKIISKYQIENNPPTWNREEGFGLGSTKAQM